MSAWVVSEAHIDFLLAYALRREHGRGLQWLKPGQAKKSDWQPGDPWGPTAVQTAQERQREITPENASDVGQMLLAENHFSVGHRYDETPTVEAGEPYEYRDPPASVRLDPVVVLKALDCYEYQSCEHPGWEGSEARAFCEALRSRAIGDLPGYDAAPWGLDFERTVRGTVGLGGNERAISLLDMTDPAKVRAWKARVKEADRKRGGALKP